MKNSVKPMQVMFNLRLSVCEMVAGLRQATGILTFTCLLLFTSLDRLYAETALDLSALPDQEIRILVIGDSLSSGYGLQGSGWVELLNSELMKAGKRITLVNDSISGDTTAGGVARISNSIERTKPDWVMIELGGNDGLRGLPPKVIEENLMHMVEIAERAGTKAMLLGIRIPPNYGRSYTEKFEQVFRLQPYRECMTHLSQRGQHSSYAPALHCYL